MGSTTTDRSVPLARPRLRRPGAPVPGPFGGRCAFSVWGLAAVLALAVGCEEAPTRVVGQGAIVQERRVLRAVDTIEIEASDALTVTVVRNVRAEGESRDSVLWIDGPADLAHYVEAEVTRSTLRIGLTHGVRLDPVPELELQVADLARVEVTGAGTVRVECGEDLPELVLASIGSARLEAQGSVRDLQVRLEGSGAAHLFGLVADRAAFRSAGSGSGWLHVLERVVVELEGSGDLTLRGDPAVAASFEGSGEVRSE